MKSFHRAYLISTLREMYDGAGVRLPLEENVPNDNVTAAPAMVPGFTGPGRKRKNRFAGTAEGHGDGRTAQPKRRGAAAASSSAENVVCTACRMVGHQAHCCPVRHSPLAPPQQERPWESTAPPPPRHMAAAMPPWQVGLAAVAPPPPQHVPAAAPPLPRQQRVYEI